MVLLSLLLCRVLLTVVGVLPAGHADPNSLKPRRQVVSEILAGLALYLPCLAVLWAWQGAALSRIGGAVLVENACLLVSFARRRIVRAGIGGQEFPDSLNQ